ncbi:MAG TPA: hypothetical protein VNA31_01215, partial [bacterium]|nr:hypothetical protein [bacterium]
PGRLAQDLALSYRKTPGGLERIAFTFTQATPAGAMSSTAHDIALFMITLLDSGMYHGRRILTPASAARMLNAQYTPHPRVWGMTHGLAEYHLRGQRAAIMGGDLGGYACMMALFPEHRLGLFAVANAPDGVNLLDPFAERYFSAPPLEPVAPRPEFTGHLGRFAGTYRSNRYPRSDFTKMTGLTVQFPVRVGPDGVLNRWGTRWVEEDSLVFRRVDREEYMVFRQDKRGRIAQLVAWNGVFDRIAWYETAMFHMVVAVTFALAFSAPLVAALLRVVLRRPHASAARPRWLVGAGLALCATNVVFLVSLGVAFARARSLVDFPVWLAALLALPLSSLVGTLVLGIGTVRVSSLGIGSPRERVASLILFLVSGAFIAWLMYWNLLGIPR